MERSPEIEGVLRRFLRCFTAGDDQSVRAMSSTMSGRRAIGTDPREWSTGAAWETMIAEVHELAAAGGVKVQFLDSDGYEDGSVGWGAANSVATMPEGVRVPLRLTGVFHLEDGHWKAVQVHFSVGVTNEERLGLEFSAPLQAILNEVQTDRPDLEGSSAPDGTVTLLFTAWKAQPSLPSTSVMRIGRS
jgi:hypothetical protein